jgi:WD40 repeat protein
MAWSPDGTELAIVVDDEIVLLNWRLGTPVNRFAVGDRPVTGLAFAYGGGFLVAAISEGEGRSGRSEICLWSLYDGVLQWKTTLEPVTELKCSPNGLRMVSVHGSVVNVWSVESRGLELLRTLKRGARIESVDITNRQMALSEFDTFTLFDLDGNISLAHPSSDTDRDLILDVAVDHEERLLATAHVSGSVRLWSQEGGLVGILQGHAEPVDEIGFVESGGLLMSWSLRDGNVCIWDTASGELRAKVKITPGSVVPTSTLLGLVTHPFLPIVVVNDSRGEFTQVYELTWGSESAIASVNYATAKIVLLGEPGAGKNGLGRRLTHGEFAEQSSTLDQQLWILDQLRGARADGTECEAVLWDLAGRRDFRLIHGLFLDDADLALILIDPARDNDPLRDVTPWLRQLGGSERPRTLLVAARSNWDMGTLTTAEVQAFCKQHDISSYVMTSALTGQGLEELVVAIKGEISWDRFPATLTTAAFNAIKDHVLAMKETADVMVTLEFLAGRLRASGVAQFATDAEIDTAVGHLSHHGFVSVLRSSSGERRLLLVPELLNDLASSIVLAARANAQELGSLTEQDVLSATADFPELRGLTGEERGVLLDSVVVLLLRHNICFREADPLSGRTYLVFPELINLRRSPIDERPVEEGAAYTLAGAVQNVYASLVVFLGYTKMFARTSHWRDQAHYEVGDGGVCGVRLEGEREDELDLVLFFGTDVPASTRTLFQSLFESFLDRRLLTVRRYLPVICDRGHRLNRSAVREQLANGLHRAFCICCGVRVDLPDPSMNEVTAPERAAVQRRSATDRSRFEQAVFRLQTYLIQEGRAGTECFISYAWGDPAHESWVERSLATDLNKVGAKVYLDRWDNARVGRSVGRFVESLSRADRVIVVGTPDYQRKNDDSHVLAAEYDLVLSRMTGSEEQKESVLPLLVAGTPDQSLPPLLRGRVRSDFRDEARYFETMFLLMLSLHDLDPHHPAVSGLLELVRGTEDS